MKYLATFIMIINMTQGAIANSPLPSVATHLDAASQSWEFDKQEQLSKKHLIKKANELEAVFLAKTIEPMFPKGDESMLFGGGSGSDIYRYLIIDEYAKILQKSGGLGLADQITQDLIQH